MSKDAAGPFAGIPPDWVGFTDIMSAVERLFGVDLRKWARHLVSAVKAGQVQHRVAGLCRQDLYLHATDRIWGAPAIRGLGYDGEERNVFVENWDEAEVDWPNGTVGGVRQQDGTRSRHRIEVWWPEVEQWAEGKVRAQQDPAVGNDALTTFVLQAPASVSRADASTVSRPAPTNQAVREWFSERVASWPDNQCAPTENDDWDAIRQYFAPGQARMPGLTRHDFRAVREDETPAGWRIQGRRKKWGEVKAKSAI